MKSARFKHWDNASVRDIVSEKARDFGTKAKISDAVSGHVNDRIGQVDETDLAFLKRLAERHDALFTIKGGVLLWLQRGAGKTADGHAMPPVVIRDTDIVPGTCKVAESDVDQFGKVKAFWQDRAGAKRREVIVDGVPDAQGEHVLRDPFASEAEARSAAESAAAEMMRGQTTTHCTVSGMPALMAGGPVFYVGVRPGIDGRNFILDTVNHSFNKSDGLRSKISGKLKVAS
jgi:phage protein D